MKSDFVICQPLARGVMLYLAASGEMLPDVGKARRFDSFEAARRQWRLGGPSATIRDLSARRVHGSRVH